MKTIRIVTILFLVLYLARITQAYFGGAPMVNLWPYIAEWASWLGLASWQFTGGRAWR